MYHLVFLASFKESPSLGMLWRVRREPSGLKSSGLWANLSGKSTTRDGRRPWPDSWGQQGQGQWGNHRSRSLLGKDDRFWSIWKQKGKKLDKSWTLKDVFSVNFGSLILTHLWFVTFIANLTTIFIHTTKRNQNNWQSSIKVDGIYVIWF